MEPAPVPGSSRSRAKSRARAATDTPKYGADDVLSDLRDPGVREIFPVPDFENLEAGDVLLLSLPQKDCVAFVESPHVAELFGSMQTPGAGATGAAGCLRICDIDLLDIPGRENEYVELVVSYTNPFVGKDFDGPSRLAFEQHYQVNILAVRQVKANPMTKGGSEHDQLPSLFAHRRNQAFSSAVASDRLPKLTARRSSGLIPLEVEQLSAGDTLLVLARTGESLQQLLDSRDFLVTTTVAHEPAEPAGAFEWVPLAIFLVCISLVAFGLMSLVRAAVLMAAVFLVFGFVNPQELRDCVDWRMLILIGSSLGIARAVKVSGLSGCAASAIRKTHLGPHGTVFALFGFVMILTEVVTSNAAAAVGFPLALDLTNELNLTSVKPLVMCVMLAASVAFTVPYACTGNLIVMGPGGYSFKDFAKIGLPMDLIYWLVCSVFLPIMWPLVTKEELGTG